MWVAEADTQELKDLLEQAKVDRYNWVAFDQVNETQYHPSLLHFFKSVTEAEEFCEVDYYEWMDTFDPTRAEQVYQYTAIDTLQHVLGVDNDKKPSLEWSVATIANILSAQSVHLLPGGRYDQLLASFQQEEVFPVVWKKLIIPEDEVAQFHIVQHMHEGGLIYETGHSHRVLASFPEYEPALAYMEHSVKLSEAAKENYDHLLIGQYKDQPLRLDMEGYPHPNCGMAFLTAHFVYDTEKHAKAYSWYPVRSIEEPHTIEQHLFARYDREGQQLKLYNDRLEQTAPQENGVSIYPGHFIKYDSITIKNSIIMNTENLDYLKENLKYAGFDRLLNEQLEKNMKDGLPEFQLTHNTKIGEDEIDYTRHYKRSETEDKYYFNTMDVTLKKPGENEAGVSQTFYQNQNITAKEAYNLLDGRAVNKTYFKHEKIGEGDDAKYQRTDQTYNTWLQLDFGKKDKYDNFELNRYNEKYGFDAERSLKDLAVKDIDDAASVLEMTRSLKRGNLVETTAKNNGISEKVYLAANPKERTLDAYDADMNKLDIKGLKLTNKANRESVSEEVTQKNEQKKGLKH